MQKDPPFITISMPVRNEELFVADVLYELLAQDYPKDRFEIIVADGESVDCTREVVNKIASSHPQVRLMQNPKRLPSSGRNVGFRCGRGEIFVVVDGHCLIRNKQFLTNLVGCFERSGAQCLGRPQPFIVNDKKPMEKAITIARSSWLGHSRDSYIHCVKEGFVSPLSVGCAYKREVFEKIGYLDESFDACEDVEFNYRVEKAGLRCFLSPKIAIHYYPRSKLPALFRQLSRYGEGRARFMFKHPETISVNMMIPSLFLGGAFLGAIGSFYSPLLAAYYGLMALVYFTVVSIETIRLAGWKHSGLAFRICCAFIVIHLSLGYGIWKGIYKLCMGQLWWPGTESRQK